PTLEPHGTSPTSPSTAAISTTPALSLLHLSEPTSAVRAGTSRSCQSTQPDSCTAAKSVVYSITSSASASSIGGIVRPSALAVLRLITSSYLVGFCTGTSAGFSPLRIRSTYEAPRRNWSLGLVP